MTNHKSFSHDLLIKKTVFIVINIDNQFQKMQTQADPLLLSLLEKIANPVSQVDLSLTLKGVFAPPEQWKQSDQTTPNIFTYTFQLVGSLLTGGKIEPRKLTEKELKDIEQAKAKKGSKKQPKEEEKPHEPDPDAQRKRLEWEALPEEERFYRTQQDPYKAFSLLWADNKKQQQLSGPTLRTFEDAVAAGFLDILLIRKPEGGEQEIAKLEKAKVKGLNLGELYSAQYKARINLQQLSVPGAMRVLQRVPLYFSGDMPADGLRIDCDKSYALVEIVLSQPLNPLVKEERPTAGELLGQPTSKVAERNLLARLGEYIRKGMRAISQEYSTFFANERDHANEDRRFTSSNNTNLFSVSTLRINEISKRKEQFLTEFASSGKYAMLRERITKTVQAIVIDRCRKERCGAAVTKKQLHRTLSELNVYLKEMAQKVLDQAVSSQASGLHEDLVLGHEYNRAGRKQTLSGMGQSLEERETRLAQEYQMINKLPEAEQKYINLVLVRNESLSSLESYALFCLKHGQYDKAYALYSQITSASNEFKHQLIISFFQAQRGREDEAIAVLIALAEREGLPQEKTLVHNLLSFLYERLGEEKKAEKYLALAEKYHQLKSNPYMKINPPKNPYIEPTPRVPKPGKYISQLSHQEDQDMRYALMNYFIDFNFYQLAKDYLPKLALSDRKRTIEALILVSEEQFEEAVTVVEELLQKDSKNMELLLLKAQICFRSERLFECEEVYLSLMKLKPSPLQCYPIYLRLALTYLHRKSWQDAKVTFNKAVELRPNSAAGWLGLGIANLRLSLLRESEQALNLSSIYNPLSSEPAEYLKEIEAQVNSQHQKIYHYLSVGAT